MRINTVRQRLLEGKPAIGVVVHLGSPLAAEFLSLQGFDFAMVDHQHGMWDDNTTMLTVRSICTGPAVPMVRVAQNDHYAIGRLLDRGMMGIVVPVVNSVEEAARAAYAVRYPPRGGRSSGSFGARFHGVDYQSWVDEQVFLAIQIESQQAIDCAEEMLAVDGVDGCWIGPVDLRYSMGVDLETPEGLEAHEAALVRVVAACRKTNKIPGIAIPLGYDIQHRLDQGFRFITVGNDIGFMLRDAHRTLESLGRTPNRVV